MNPANRETFHPVGYSILQPRRSYQITPLSWLLNDLWSINTITPWFCQCSGWGSGHNIKFITLQLKPTELDHVWFWKSGQQCTKYVYITHTNNFL